MLKNGLILSFVEDTMHKFSADKNNNRLYMIMEGLYTIEKMKLAADEAISEANKLSPGYVVINDISKLQVNSDEANDYVKQMMDFANSRDVKKVIRIIGRGDSKKYFNGMSIFANYDVIEVESMLKAEEFLVENNL